jgi:hypothetical protein
MTWLLVMCSGASINDFKCKNRRFIRSAPSMSWYPVGDNAIIVTPFASEHVV